jgi:hypothetical protein
MISEDVSCERFIPVDFSQLFHDGWYRFLFSVAKDEIDLSHTSQFFGLRLGVTTGHDDRRIGRQAPRPPDRVPAAGVALSGDGAGVDDIEAGLLVESATGPVPYEERFTNVLGFELVEFATEGHDCERFPRIVSGA